MENEMKTQEIRAIDSKTLWQAINPTTTKASDSVVGLPTQESENATPTAAVSTASNKVVTQAATPKALNAHTFPDQPRAASHTLPATIANLAHMLGSYGITARYDVIRKKLYIIIPGASGTPDNADNVAINHVISLANLNGMPIGQIQGFIEVIGDQCQQNPVMDWIMGKPWDGIDRLIPFYATLIQKADFPETLKKQLMYRWLLSAATAALKPSGFKARGVLTLQGPQSIGKTTWFSALVPDEILREGVLKLDHHLDAGNKDSIITAVCHWIVEIGELDSSFKKDIARLKGFLTSDRDKVRRPYGRTDSEYPRRTVFCATVNEHDFLVDSTGNSRFWSIPVTAVNYQHGIDMQQLFAQLAIDFTNGEQWWLTREEEALLELHNKNHRAISAIRERILDALDLDHINDGGLRAMTATELLQGLGIKVPTTTQSKESASVLRELLGESKKIRGSNKWRIPFKKEDFNVDLTPVDDDIY
jgi:putative DNA primase/helicase